MLAVALDDCHPVWQLFASRARLADIVKVDTKAVGMAELEAAIKEMVPDNPKSSDGRVQKVTLAIGAGGDEKAEL